MKLRGKVLPVSVIVLALAVPGAAVTGCTEHVKEPAVAGAFYPAAPEELSGAVDAYLAGAQAKPGNGKLIALIAPHAGYVYSGPVAAHSYRHLAERDVDTVILIGSSHNETYTGASVYARGSMKTPLGLVRINRRIAESLLSEAAHVTFRPEAYAREHSLEVQLPFLQKTAKGVTVVPVLIGVPTRESFAHLTDKLTGILKRNDRAIIIASTDLSHYHDYKTAAAKDRKVIDAVRRMSGEELSSLLSGGEGEMCGGYPVLLTMMVARNLGVTNGVLYQYANSGDVTGDRSRVVGYAAMGLYRSELTGEQKRELLGLARRTVAAYVKSRKTPEAKVNDSRLQANAATFVTINRKGRLRGCIGNIQPVVPLYQSVMKNAAAASSHDSRFPAMAPGELADMEVEITILSPLEPLLDTADLRVGTHGLYIVKDRHTGLLLPQVAAQYGWDSKTFLEQVCAKAGLPADAWKEAKLYTFTADILKE